jgi:hypothetical protein
MWNVVDSVPHLRCLHKKGLKIMKQLFKNEKGRMEEIKMPISLLLRYFLKTPYGRKRGGFKR